MNKILKNFFRIFLALFILLNIVLAFHAYKFTHFYDQQEITIKNSAQKNFWDRTKEILFGFNFIKEKNPSPDSGFETIYLTTKNGLRLEGWYQQVKNSKGTVA